MNQDKVKDILLQIKKDVEDFTVTFSGKKSTKVNGLYKPDSKEIIIHNKNFEDDNALIYTAVHEFAHHVHFTTAAIPISSKSHTKEFWAIFHTLLMDAEEKKIYVNIFHTNQEFSELTKEIKESYISKNGQLMKDFGKLLIRAVNLCQIHNVRFEDYVDRALLLNRTAASSIMKVYTMDVNPEIGFDNMKIVANIKDDDEREEIQNSFVEGTSSVDLIKSQLANKDKSEDSKEILIKEKEKIERTIERLSDKLAQLEEKLESLD